VNRVLSQSYLVRTLQFSLRKLGLIPQPYTPSPVQLETLRPRVTPAQYKENLGGIARWAHDNGSRVLFVLFGDNPVRTDHLNRGIEHLHSGQLAEALEELWIARRDDWFGDLARLKQAELLRLSGQHAEADKVTIGVPYWSLHGGRPIILDTDYNVAMREVAAEYGVDVVDARSALARFPGVFMDHVHIDARGHRIVAEHLAGPIETLLAADD
jgi:lysophospholipase L1-like esterase